MVLPFGIKMSVPGKYSRASESTSRGSTVTFSRFPTLSDLESVFFCKKMLFLIPGQVLESVRLQTRLLGLLPGLHVHLHRLPQRHGWSCHHRNCLQVWKTSPKSSPLIDIVATLKRGSTSAAWPVQAGKCRQANACRQMQVERQRAQS